MHDTDIYWSLFPDTGTSTMRDLLKQYSLTKNQKPKTKNQKPKTKNQKPKTKN
jgi:hypothetical protein